MANEGPLSINIDLSQTKTAVPMVADGHLCRWRLVNLTGASTEKGNVLKFEYDLVSPAPNIEGGIINPGEMGAKHFENIQLYAKPDAKDPKWFEKKIATRIDALLGSGDAGNTKDKPTRPSLSAETVPTLIGKELIAKMAVKTGEYTGNEFKAVYFPGDIQA